MSPMFPAFPGGGAGAGLLLLRLSISAALIAALMTGADPPAWKSFLAFLTAIGLCAGFRTRLFAGLCMALLAHSIAAGSVALVPAVLSLADALALALIGPGAFSIDARIFGRRIVVLGRGRNPNV